MILISHEIKSSAHLNLRDNTCISYFSTLNCSAYKNRKVKVSTSLPLRHTFLTSAPDGGVASLSCSGRFTLGKELRYPLYSGLGVHRGSVDILEKK